MKKIIFIPIFLFLFIVTAAAERINTVAPSALPATERQMKTAGYWISRQPHPDKVILTPAEVSQFNASVRNLKLTHDLARFPEIIDGIELSKTIEDTYQKLADDEFYRRDDTATDQSFFENIKADLNLSAIEEQVPVRYGFIVHYADQRLLPTDEALYAQQGDIDFDELQNSALDVGTPVAMLHQSPDGKWLYCRSDSSDGWIRADDVAVGKKEDFDDFFAAKLFVINLTPKADIFLDPKLTQYYDYVQMGTRFALIKGKSPGVLKVRLPTRGAEGELIWRDGYANADDFNAGYLEYTPRQIIQQAFKLLNAPYGWGGMYGEQDCSRFLQEIFSTVGLSLPRNSSEQIQVGKQLAQFEPGTNLLDKIELLAQNGVGGITLLGMKGHIMLYLGTVNKLPYAIHETWAYRENIRGEEKARVLNRVVVSNLLLGEETRKGSLLNRLNRITLINICPEEICAH